MNKNSFILLLDFYKAFDSLDHRFIQQSPYSCCNFTQMLILRSNFNTVPHPVFSCLVVLVKAAWSLLMYFYMKAIFSVFG